MRGTLPPRSARCRSLRLVANAFDASRRARPRPSPDGVAILIVLLLALPLAAGGADRTWTRSTRWSTVRTAKDGPARAIGAYNAGCVQGAVALPPDGPGFEVMHLGRHRYFGHPALIGFVRRLALAASEEHLPVLLVGDLGQPRGGPTPTDHGSHQSGLDVDIAYTRPVQTLWQPLPASEREGLQPPPVVDLATQKLNAAWTPMVAELIGLAASDPAVERVFVNPAIKHALCAHQEPGARWLAKLRPWWGHHDHFHVRLKCPAGSGECRPQPPVTDGDGCDLSLAWWFTNDARATAATRRGASHGLAGAPLPAHCRDVLR
jgi:penicillin-insensitive murein DD-endopeptidase